MSQMNETTPSHTIPLISILIIHFHLCLSLESDFFPSHFQLSFPMRDICLVHLTLTFSDSFKLHSKKNAELRRLLVLVIRE